ncbi:8842_t:CDS:2, partial [Dentiscutata erythropus]
NEIIEIINYVIGDIDQSTLEKINETVALPIDQLIAPSINRRGRQIPRPQNSFVLYRRNLNAVINNRNDIKSEFNFISKEASINWSKESNEVKQLYELLADYAKQVHNLLYPDYSYKPKQGGRHSYLRKQYDVIGGECWSGLFILSILREIESHQDNVLSSLCLKNNC